MIDFTNAKWINEGELYTKEERNVFKALTKAILSSEDEILLNGNYPDHFIFNILYDVKYSNPLTFGLRDAYVDSNYGGLTRVFFRYYDEYNQWKTEIRDRVKDLYEKMDIGGCKTDLEKEIVVNEWLCKNCVYDKTIEKHLRHSVLGILLYSHGVCSSFALCVSLLLMCFGVKCYPILGKMTKPEYKQKFESIDVSDFIQNIKGNPRDYDIFRRDDKRQNPSKISTMTTDKIDYEDTMNHAWNYVYIEKQERHLDVTFNNGYYNDRRSSKTQYSCFNMIKAEFDDRKIFFGPEIDEKREYYM